MKEVTRLWRTLPVLALMMSASCTTVGPKYRPPELQLPPQWNALPDADIQMPLDEETLAQWWTAFDDPTLMCLIGAAVEGNLDVQTALSRIRQARASLQVAQKDLRPVVTAGLSSSLRRSSEEAGSGRVTDSYNLGFDSGWEADLFGRIDRSIEAGAAALQAREADLGDVLVTLVAEVGVRYVGLRSLQERLSIAEAQLQAQEETYALARFRALAGLTTELDVEQARSNLESTRARVPHYEATVLSALQEVEDAMVSLAKQQVRRQHLTEAVSAAEQAVKLSTHLYAAGLRDFRDVLDAQRSLLSSQDQLAVSHAEISTVLIRLYKALGGGWAALPHVPD